MVVDEAINLKFYDFYTTKDGMLESTLSKWSKWRGMGFEVTTVRLDNAGENKKVRPEPSPVNGSWQIIGSS
jgi:hypothetical protein